MDNINHYEYPHEPSHPRGAATASYPSCIVSLREVRQTAAGLDVAPMTSPLTAPDQTATAPLPPLCFQAINRFKDFRLKHPTDTVSPLKR